MLTDILTTPVVRRLAGARYFERGEAYFYQDRIRGLKERNGKITATVAGTYNYRVMLWEDDGALDYHCTCPLGLDGEFCKHCVATALAWLEEHPTTDSNTTGKRKQRKKANKGLTRKDLRAWLLLQEKETLADMVLEAAADDEQLENRLMLRAAAAEDVNLATYRRIIDQALKTRGFVDYHHMYDYWRGADEAVDAIAELLGQGHAAAVIELSEYALSGVERAIEGVDDSDGYMSMLLERLQELHLAACRKAKPDPKALAERLFRWELNGEWDTFHGAVKTYARILGKQGRERYRELAETEWAKVKPLKPGDDDRDKYGKRFHITSIMESLAEQSGDIEALVAVKSRDLSSSYDFLEIAEISRKARQGEKALEWAEKGVRAFGKSTDSRLQDFLADLYHRRKRHDEAMALIWPQLERRPCLENYQKLKKHADRSKTWPEWREKALGHICKLNRKSAQHKPHNRWNVRPGPDRSLLVAIFLWEKDVASAWKEAMEGGCHKGLWLELAALREKDHPRDAIAVYQNLIGPIVEQTNNDAYRNAAGLLRRIKNLMTKLGEQAEFRRYLADVRIEYKRKRNFIKLLEKFD